jgi:predicted O-methyltransferase YrrM
MMIMAVEDDMNILELLNSFGFGKKTTTVHTKPRDDANLDIVLAWALQQASARQDILFPVAYLDLLRGCLEKKTLDIREIKKSPVKSGDTALKQFASLVDALKNLPPIEFAIADDIARAADSLRGNQSPMETDHWAGDIRSHFEMSSSFGGKGRILTAVIRYTRSNHCLELGTAYGMSALFILEALKAQGENTHLTTVEGSQLQHLTASQILKTRYGDRVSCEYGWTGQVLPQIIKSIPPVNFLFHDAGHSRKDYVSDFHTLLPVLAPGAVVLIDDINWNDPRFYSGNPQCYKGWREVVSHPRVRWAVEIDNDIGLLLVD